ncbi:MAG: hypothetical protein WDN48_06840 [Pseudolabrys sp.]
MKKVILAIAAVATIAVGSLSVPTTADARCRGNCAFGVGAAALGLGIVAGAAIANSGPRYYGPAPGYVVYEGYGAPTRQAAPAATGPDARSATATAMSSAGPARASSVRKGVNGQVIDSGA